MNVSMQARLVRNDRYLFVNTQRANPSIKTVSRFFEYKTWTEQIWRTEIIENGNAFFHWQGHDRKNGHRDTILTPKGTPADIRREGNLDGLEKPEGSSATLMLNVLLHNFQRRTSARASKV